MARRKSTSWKVRLVHNLILWSLSDDHAFQRSQARPYNNYDMSTPTPINNTFDNINDNNKIDGNVHVINRGYLVN